MSAAVFPKIDPTIATPEIAELVRGNERQLLDRIAPLVRQQDVTLDLASIDRIDAAGLAALVTLYRDASKAGRRFAVANPTPRVRRVLALVGLDAILLYRGAKETASLRPQLEQSAA